MLDRNAAQAELKTACARLAALPRTPRTTVFSVISDLHTISCDLDTADPGRRNTLPVIALTHDADRFANLDFFADLGDVAPELPENNPAEVTDKLLEAYSAEHLKSDKVTLICMGNHDTDFGRIAPAQFGKGMNLPQARRSSHIVFGDNASYGYYDLPAKRVRTFFLNTGRTYDSTPEQNAFVRAKLAELCGDWIALFLSHYAPHPAGEWQAPWNSGAWSLQPALQELVDVIRSSERSAMLFCGDSHFDTEFALGRVPGFVTQGYGGIKPEWIPHGGRRHEVDTAKNFLMELVAVIPERREIQVIRAGVGGAHADRSAHF